MYWTVIRLISMVLIGDGVMTEHPVVVVPDDVVEVAPMDPQAVVEPPPPPPPASTEE